jgi:hypothetical protein
MANTADYSRLRKVLVLLSTATVISGCLAKSDATAVHGPFGSGGGVEGASASALAPASGVVSGSQSRPADCVSSAVDSAVLSLDKAFGAFRTYLQRPSEQGLLAGASRNPAAVQSAQRAITYMEGVVQTSQAAGACAVFSSLPPLGANAQLVGRAVSTGAESGVAIEKLNGLVTQWEAAAGRSGLKIVEDTSFKLP